MIGSRRAWWIGSMSGKRPDFGGGTSSSWGMPEFLRLRARSSASHTSIAAQSWPWSVSSSSAHRLQSCGIVIAGRGCAASSWATPRLDARPVFSPAFSCPRSPSVGCASMLATAAAAAAAAVAPRRRRAARRRRRSRPRRISLLPQWRQRRSTVISLAVQVTAPWAALARLPPLPLLQSLQLPRRERHPPSSSGSGDADGAELRTRWRRWPRKWRAGWWLHAWRLSRLWTRPSPGPPCPGLSSPASAPWSGGSSCGSRA
mmetsp:Transcript_67255/g.174271  ORF Transcript_67255/g.174271 Transcript_67255/m.174271 type:complete len:259 (-) Transcript_67255:1929-2705(-)